MLLHATQAAPDLVHLVRPLGSSGCAGQRYEARHQRTIDLDIRDAPRRDRRGGHPLPAAAEDEMTQVLRLQLGRAACTTRYDARALPRCVPVAENKQVLARPLV